MKAKKKAGFNHSKLRSVMAEKKISNVWLAKKLKKNEHTISNWKQEVSQPTWTGLLALAKVLGMNYKEFLI